MKYKAVLDEHKGVAGLEVFLALITMLFMIGIIVMVFAIAGAKLETAIAEDVAGEPVNNETVSVTTNTTYVKVAMDSNDGCQITGIFVLNESDGTVIHPDNYTTSGCGIRGSPTIPTTSGNLGDWNVTYNWTYWNMQEARDAISDTYTGIADSTDWFPTFIVLGALVVLILLVVIIINSIKGVGIGEGA